VETSKTPVELLVTICPAGQQAAPPVVVVVLPSVVVTVVDAPVVPVVDVPVVDEPVVPVVDAPVVEEPVVPVVEVPVVDAPVVPVVDVPVVDAPVVPVVDVPVVDAPVVPVVDVTVVTVVPGAVVVVVVAPPAQVSQQLPGPPDTPPLSSQALALGEMRQRGGRRGRSTQQVTKLGPLPHVELSAHSVSACLHSCDSAPLTTASRPTRRTQRTYCRWLVPPQSQFACARARASARPAVSVQPLAPAGRASTRKGTERMAAKTSERAFILAPFPA
jgi:hypothetical protein